MDKVFGASLDVGGTEGKYVTLLCGPSASSSVEWWDYGTDGTFTSTPLKMAKGSTVDPSYSNQNRIFVNASNNYSLTINKLQFSDEKYYKCSGGLSYHLFVMGKTIYSINVCGNIYIFIMYAVTFYKTTEMRQINLTLDDLSLKNTFDFNCCNF